MLVLHKISLVQFKNALHTSYEFKQKIIGFCGRNGAGKTNLLDAIYYLCFTKSYFSKSDTQNVHFGSEGFRIEGDFLKGNNPEKIVCILRENGKKECSVNDDPYLKLSHHIGRFPCVMVAPDDVEIIIGGSEERRKFVDYTLSQSDPVYLQALMDYNKILQQRNGLLRSYDSHKDESLLEVLTAQLIPPGELVHTTRKKMLRHFLPLLNKFYDEITGIDEPVEVSYHSQLNSDSLVNLLKNNLQKDILLQRTNAGIHRDDLVFHLNGENFKSVASQGQRKSLLFALKLAEFEFLSQQKGFAPILLLDDVFEKLDDSRMHNLLNRVCVQNEGQVFITDTHCDRLNESLKALNLDFEIFELKST